MSFKNILSVANLIFIVGGIYFVLVAALNQGTVYALIPAVLCFVAFGLSFVEDLYFTGPWRVATAVAVLVLLVGQEVASFAALSGTNGSMVGTIALNGVLFVLFLGVLLLSSKEVVRLKTHEEPEEEEEKDQKRVITS